MVGYRRNKPANPDAEFFITVVTRHRNSWFSSISSRNLIQFEMANMSNRYDLKFLAWVILPNHIHWLLAPCKADYSKLVFTFKKAVSSKYKMRGSLSTGDKFWQDRFWEHTIRDNDERRQYVEYIHYNPVKHNLVTSPRDWQHSSFQEYVDSGIYPMNWSDGDLIVVPGLEYDL